MLIVKVWVSNTLQSALERGQEARIVQIDFSAAFDRVNYQGILYKEKIKFSMARSLPVENIPPQNVGSIINYLQ